MSLQETNLSKQSIVLATAFLQNGLLTVLRSQLLAGVLYLPHKSLSVWLFVGRVA